MEKKFKKKGKMENVETELISLINQAKLATKEQKKTIMANISERLLHRHTHLLNNYFTHVVDLALDSADEVQGKIMVFKFMEQVVNKESKSE